MAAPGLVISFLLSSLIIVYFRKRFKAKNDDLASVQDLKGPSSSSWLAGNLRDFLSAENTGDMDKRLMRQFGLTCKIKEILNADALYLVDPKGLQYVLNTSGYNFHKRNAAKTLRMMFGEKNILAVEAPSGDEHARQRRILTPSFSQSHVHEIVPDFIQATSKLIECWNNLIAERDTGIDIDLHIWLSRLTLDAIGQGVLSYDFKALSDEPSEYVEAYRGLFVDMFTDRSNFQIAMGDVMGRLPISISQYLLSLSVQGMNKFKRFMSVSSKISSSIILREKEATRLGKPHSKDLMSALIRANLSQNPRDRLTDEEVLSQVNAFTMAGHDTTSSMLQWVFYELSLHPEAQAKIREEIGMIKATKNVQVIGASEFESMHYTMAVLKETLRFHPIGLHNQRRADKEDVIPLAYPVKTASGKEVRAIRVKKGQLVFISQYGYNRIEDLWGKDADKWNPERFLNEKESDRSKRTIGVFANLATFSSGVHACTGWRFALLEMQAILIGLLEHFEFYPATSNPIILGKQAATMYSAVKGEEDRGAQMPLFIKPVS